MLLHYGVKDNQVLLSPRRDDLNPLITRTLCTGNLLDDILPRFRQYRLIRLHDDADQLTVRVENVLAVFLYVLVPRSQPGGDITHRHPKRLYRFRQDAEVSYYPAVI
ncbi:hypothetical protein D3C79_845440 [compost metagenome]